MTNTMKWLGLTATLVIVILLPLYTILEPTQQETLRRDYYTTAVLTSTNLYAENCAVCHGASGGGIGENPSLNSDAVRLMPAENLAKVIARGRTGTLMAGWAADEGGIFTNPQVNDLVTFVQQANWDFVETRVTELGLTPPEVIQMEVSETMLASLESLPDSQILQDGLLVYAERCAACHGANAAGTVIAPALDSAELRSTPKDETIQLVNNGVPGSLMAGWGDLLAQEQVSAVVDLVYRWPEMIQTGVEFPEVEVLELPSSPELIADGQRLFNIACKSCHGVDGYGTPMAPALNNQIFLSETPDAAIYQIIAGGVSGTLMPAWGSRLTDQELQALAAFLRSLETTAPVIVPPIRE